MKRGYLILSAAAILLLVIAAAGCVEETPAQSSPIVGSFTGTSDLPYLGNQPGELYTLYYEFWDNGRGMQAWISERNKDMHLLPLTWKEVTSGLYMLTVINPDGTIYQETVRLDEDYLIPSSYGYAGVYVRCEPMVFE